MKRISFYTMFTNKLKRFDRCCMHVDYDNFNWLQICTKYWLQAAVYVLYNMFKYIIIQYVL